jgi:hypothetical protein
MTLSLESFFDELEKISAVNLTTGEKRKQMAQFAGLGAVTLPALALSQEKVRTGRWFPKGVSKKRTLGAAAIGGLFWGGALPLVRRAIAKSNVNEAKDRIAAGRELRKLAPEGVGSALKSLPAKDPTLPGVSNAG